MLNAALSADGFISFSLALLIFTLTVLSAVHELKDALNSKKHGSKIVAISERAKQWVFAAIERGYRLRFVSLFVMLALFVSTVSPVSTLLEIEENIVSRSCEGLSSARLIVEGETIESCKDAAKKSGFSFVEAKFGKTQNHLLQVAMWPLVASVYGFTIAAHFRFARNRSDESITAVIERAPHSYHIIHGLLAFSAAFVGFIQNFIGT